MTPILDSLHQNQQGKLIKIRIGWGNCPPKYFDETKRQGILQSQPCHGVFRFALLSCGSAPSIWPQEFEIPSTTTRRNQSMKLDEL